MNYSKMNNKVITAAKTTENPGSFTDHARKQVIRVQWAKVMLDLIKTKLGKKLIYVGLPGVLALDVKEWLDYIERVIAFQCDDYNKEDSSESTDYDNLLELLTSLDRTEKLARSFALYNGYIEDVVIGGIDKKGQQFILNDFVTLYNLDFCNTLTSPRRVVDEYGSVTTYYKLDVIEKLLSIQREIENTSTNKFIMFLTVNSNFMAQELDSIREPYILAYRKRLEKTKAAVRDVRLLKAYTFYFLNKQFNQQGFNVEFLPPIFYQGSDYPNKSKGGKREAHWMLTFTILGTKINDGETPYAQDGTSFLNNKFIWANNTNISCFNDASLEEVEFPSSVYELFTGSHSYTTLWS